MLMLNLKEMSNIIFFATFCTNLCLFIYNGVRAILTTKREALPIGPQSSSLESGEHVE